MQVYSNKKSHEHNPQFIFDVTLTVNQQLIEMHSGPWRWNKKKFVGRKRRFPRILL